MESSCKRRPHNHKCQHCLNRFTTAKLYFNNSLVLVSFAVFVSIFMFPYHYQVSAGKTTIEELNTKSVVQITEQTLVVIPTNKNNNTSSQLQSERNIHNTIPHHVEKKHYNPFEETVDVNNDILSNAVESPEIKISPDFVNSQGDHPMSTENLEESIRNSVKTEIELEQNLESSPVLEILKELPEPEIRKTLTADIMSLEQENLKENDTEIDQTKEGKPEKTALNNEPIMTDARNLENRESKIYNSGTTNDFNLSSASSSESNSFETKNVLESTKLLKKSLIVANLSVAISSESNSSENSEELFKDNENNSAEEKYNFQREENIILAEVDPTIPVTSQKLQSSVNSHPSDVTILYPNDDSLSVVFNETFSATVISPGEENLLSLEGNPTGYLELVTQVAEESTIYPEELEHVVIKKVLDVHEIFEDISETTEIPFEQKLQTPEFHIKDVEEQSSGNVEAVVEYENIQFDNENTNKQINTKADAIYVENRIVTSNFEQYTTEHSNVENDEEMKNENLTINVMQHRIKNSQNPLNLNHKELVEQDSNDALISEVLLPSTKESINNESNSKNAQLSFETKQFNSQTATNLNSKEFLMFDKIPGKGVDKPIKESRSVNIEKISSQFDEDPAATLFEAYPPRNAGQTFNDNLADESTGIGRALPVSNNDGPNRSTTIIVISSGMAFIFIVILVTIFIISFQRQHGTLDIEMQERNCGKDDLDDEDAETFAKLLEVELPPSIAIALDETEECL